MLHVDVKVFSPAGISHTDTHTQREARGSHCPSRTVFLLQLPARSALIEQHPGKDLGAQIYSQGRDLTAGVGIISEPGQEGFKGINQRVSLQLQQTEGEQRGRVKPNL